MITLNNGQLFCRAPEFGSLRSGVYRFSFFCTLCFYFQDDTSLLYLWKGGPLDLNMAEEMDGEKRSKLKSGSS